MNSFSLKPNMLLGVSSAATEIDGGALNHTWNDWHEKGRIRGGDPAVAAGHWDNWKDDVLLMHRLGVQTYRLGIEWARVEPEEGVFDKDAIVHIKEELMLLIALGIKPMVTLHHFSDPMWFAEKGGWERYDNVRCFLIYVERVVREIGHLVSEYITINEPNVYAANGYALGLWPPGKKKAAAAANVMSNLAAAHIKAYRLIHDVRRQLGFRNSRVSFANHLRVFEPKNRVNPVDLSAAVRAERRFQTLLTEAMITGEFHRPLRNNGRDRKGTYCDFHAVSYYTRSTVAGFGESARDGSCKNDLGWEIFPEGILRVCHGLIKLRAMPIYIIANGTCDQNDSFRSRYIYEHLKQIAESKLPIKRYYYSNFLDGFSWQDGNCARFGLVQTDGDTGRRTVKRSGEFYAKIIEHGGVTDALYEQYVAGQEYHF